MFNPQHERRPPAGLRKELKKLGRWPRATAIANGYDPDAWYKPEHNKDGGNDDYDEDYKTIQRTS